MIKKLFLLTFLFILVGCSSKESRQQANWERGDKLLKKGNKKAAIIAYRNALAQDKNNEKGVVKLAKLYRDTGSIKKCSKVLTEFLLKNKGTADTWYKLARCRYLERKSDQAIESCGEALKIDPDHIDSIILLGNIYEEHKEKTAAKDLYLSVTDKMHLGKELVPVLLKLAALEIETGKEKELKSAGVHLLSARKLAPKSTKVLSALGLYYLKQKQPGKARRVFKKWIEFYPEDGMAYLHLGQANLMLGKNEKSFEAFKKASQLRSSDILPLMGIVKVAPKINKNKEIYPALLKASTLKPADKNIKWKLIPWQIKKERYKVALKGLNQLKQDYQHKPEYYKLKSKVHEGLGEYSQAWENYMRVLSSGGKSTADFKKKAGILARYAGYHKKAVEYLEPLYVKEQDPEVGLNLALAQIDSKEKSTRQRGVELLKQLAAKNNTQAAIWLANYYLRQNNSMKAKSILDQNKKQIKLEDKIFYLDVLAQYYEKKNNHAKHLDTLKKQVKLARNDHEKSVLEKSISRVKEEIESKKKKKKKDKDEKG
ncbi:MAG: tetratricopeptide repeat protein [Myxococcota bacterium]